MNLTKCLMMRTTMQATNAVVAHRDAVRQYFELSLTAAAGYPDPLTDDQRAAYLTLTYLMDECREAWDRLPVDARSPHYLLSC
jgi:hypothetical protein